MDALDHCGIIHRPWYLKDTWFFGIYPRETLGSSPRVNYDYGTFYRPYNKGSIKYTPILQNQSPPRLWNPQIWFPY